MLTLRDRLWRRSGAWLALSYRASTPPCTPVKAAFTKGRQMQTLHFRVAPKDTPGIGAEWAGPRWGTGPTARSRPISLAAGPPPPRHPRDIPPARRWLCLVVGSLTTGCTPSG
jgi:hypothetical protein